MRHIEVHRKAESVTGIQIIMSPFKSIRYLLLLVCSLQLIQLHGVVSRQTYITSYTHHYGHITFHCSDDAQKNIVSEYLTSGFVTTAVKFAHCEWNTLPDAERQLSTLHFCEWDLSAIALESLAVDDLESIHFTSYCGYQTLNLSSNRLQQIDQPVFRNQKNVYFLDLSNNRLRSLSNDAFSDLTQLLHLFLQRNHISVILNGTFAKLGGLTALDVSENQLQTVNSDFFRNLTVLSELDLHGNNISDIAANAFGELLKLRVLNLSFNRLYELNSHTFAGLVWLRTLALQQNAIKMIGNNTFIANSVLNSLDLSSNRLQLVDVDSFRTLSQLTFLDLSHNGLTQLSDATFRDLQNQCFGASLRNLAILNLSFNDIRTLKVGDFVHFQRLQQLNVSASRLESLEFGSMTPLRTLQVLDLSSNRLKVIDFDVFLPGLPDLWSLYLDGNQLTELTDQCDRLFPRLNSFSVTNNAFNCSYVKRFLNMLDKNLHRAIHANPASHLANIGGITCTFDEAEATQQDTNGFENRAAIRAENDLAGAISTLNFMATLTVLILAAIASMFGVILYKNRHNWFERDSGHNSGYDQNTMPLIACDITPL